MCKKFLKFYNGAFKYLKQFPELRQGQSFVNYLCDFDYDAYCSIVGSPIDLFYDDGVMVEFLRFLGDRWSETSRTVN